MREKKLGIMLLLGVLSLGSCDLGKGIILPASGLITSGGNTYKIWLPPHFADTGFTQKYPLVISLHGATSATDYYFAPCIVGNEAEALKYPCVFFAPNSVAGYGTSVSWIRQTINQLIRNPDYRIDENRIYIIGFSMGGFGCTNIARDLYNEYGYLVAGILPSGGGNYPDLPDPAGRFNTAMWIHYGLAGDYSQESDYDAAKAFLTGAVETVVNDVSTYVDWNGGLTPYPRQTRTLRVSGIELFKISTYEGMGHSTGPIYHDPKVLDWLFAQDLRKR